MIDVTPAGHHYSRANQDCDERQALLADLTHRSAEYLQHPDPTLRALARATYHAYKLEAPGLFRPACHARITLGLFYHYLRSRASTGQGQATGAPAGTAPSVHQKEPVV